MSAAASCSLPVPPPNRHRASSTNVRPPLTLGSLGRRRSSSLHLPSELTPIPATPCVRDTPALTLTIPSPASASASTTFSSSPRSKLASMFVSLTQALHASPDSFPSTPSSPLHSRASTDDSSILPLSASPTRAFFDDLSAASEKPQTKARAKAARLWDGHPSVHAPVLFVLIIFPLSTLVILLCATTLPITAAWPRNLPDLAQLGRELHGYALSGALSTVHVIGVLSAVTIWMHSWSIPGSVLANVLAGALFPPALAIPLLTLLTTLGSLSASMLAAPLGPFLTRLMPRPLAMTRSVLEGDEAKDGSAAWVRLSILRLIGVVPWSGINIACGVCGVAVWDCFLGALIGSLPWTAVTCQIGDILQTLATSPRPSMTVQSVLTSPEIVLKLALLSFLSLAPILGRNHLRAWLSQQAPAQNEASPAPASARGSSEEKARRWAWVKEWRSRIRSASHSRTREASQKTLEVLVREKEALPL